MRDSIHIEALELSSFIGVPEEERAEAQRLTVNLQLELRGGFAGLPDEIGRTVDYSAVCEAVKRLSLARPRQLLETLAEEIAAAILGEFAVAAVQVELRKYILPDTAFVAVRLRRER
jgi:dihydroneopterin aldolase